MNHLEGVYVIRELVGYTTFFTFLFSFASTIIGGLITLYLIIKGYDGIRIFLPLIAGCIACVFIGTFKVGGKPYSHYEIKINNEVSKIEFDETYEVIEDEGQHTYIVKFKDQP